MDLTNQYEHIAVISLKPENPILEKVVSACRSKEKELKILLCCSKENISHANISSEYIILKSINIETSFICKIKEHTKKENNCHELIICAIKKILIFGIDKGNLSICIASDYLRDNKIIVDKFNGLDRECSIIAVRKDIFKRDLEIKDTE